MFRRDPQLSSHRLGFPGLSLPDAQTELFHALDIVHGPPGSADGNRHLVAVLNRRVAIDEGCGIRRDSIDLDVVINIFDGHEDSLEAQ